MTVCKLLRIQIKTGFRSFKFAFKKRLMALVEVQYVVIIYHTLCISILRSRILYSLAYEFREIVANGCTPFTCWSIPLDKLYQELVLFDRYSILRWLLLYHDSQTTELVNPRKIRPSDKNLMREMTRFMTLLQCCHLLSIWRVSSDSITSIK